MKGLSVHKENDNIFHLYFIYPKFDYNLFALIRLKKLNNFHD